MKIVSRTKQKIIISRNVLKNSRFQNDILKSYPRLGYFGKSGSCSRKTWNLFKEILEIVQRKFGSFSRKSWNLFKQNLEIV
eukprot:UN14642